MEIPEPQEHCALCGIAVAPRAPERMVINRRVFHAPCIVRNRLTVSEVRSICSRKRFRVRDFFRRSASR